MGWTSKTDTYKRTIVDPETEETADVELRPLSWGTTLRMNEIKLGADADGGVARLSPGDNKLLMVEMALVAWTLPLPITRDVLQQLNPLVGEQPRYPWHDCPCCVGNIPRTLLMVPTWTYVKDVDDIFVNQQIRLGDAQYPACSIVYSP